MLREVRHSHIHQRSRDPQSRPPVTKRPLRRQPNNSQTITLTAEQFAALRQEQQRKKLNGQQTLDLAKKLASVHPKTSKQGDDRNAA